MKKKPHFDPELLINLIPARFMLGLMSKGFPLFLVNDRMLKYLGYETEEEFFRDNDSLFDNAMHPDDLESAEREMDKQLANGDEYIIEYRMRKKDGTWFWVHDVGTRIMIEGQLDFACICFDITKQREELNSVRQQASIDPLTNTLNRNVFEERTNALLSTSPDTYALLIIDLDDFKKVNDTYGHLHGDFVLQKLAENLRTTFRVNDPIGRLGGDEFEVFLANVRTRSGLISKLDELLDLMKEPMDLGGCIYEQQISIGVVYVTSGMQYSFTELYAMADNLLYKAKQQGKNSYRIEVC